MSCVNCGDNANKPCGCPDTDCHQVKSSELGELQTLYGKDENGCPKYELPASLICRELAGKEQGADAVFGQTNIIDPDTCQKRKLPALPNAAQVITDDTLTVVNTGTSSSPVWQLAVNICNSLAKIVGSATRLPYGSTMRLIGNDCNAYLLPNAPAFDSPDGTVQVTPGGTGIAPLYSLVVNTCAVLAKITGNPIKLPFGGGVLVGKDCQLYQLPDLPVMTSSDQSVMIQQGGTATSPTFNFVVNLCKALLNVTDANNVVSGNDKVLVRNPNGTCEMKNIPAQQSLCADLESLPNGGALAAGDKVVVPGENGNPCSLKTVQNPSGDNWGTQVVQHDNTITGDGTAGNPLHVVPCAVIQGVTTSATQVQNGDLIPVKKADGTCEARPIQFPTGGGDVQNDCTLVNNAGVLGVNSTALIAGSTYTPGSVRQTFSNQNPHVANAVISNVVSANISNPSTCRTGKVKVDVDFGYWGYQIDTAQDFVIAAKMQINVGGAGWVDASTMLGDEGKDLYTDPNNKSDMGQDGTSISFIATVPISGSVNVQARVIALTSGNVSYSENPVISWFGLAI